MKNVSMIIISIFVLVSVSILAIFSIPKSSHQIVIREVGGSQCGKDCKGLDPIMDPLYNIKQIVENCLLLESHLIDDKKLCYPCITKHHLLITGLSEEALWLSGKNYHLYPNLKENVVYFNDLFKYWLDNKDDQQIRFEVLTKIRDKRKELIRDYFLNGKELQEKLRKANVTYT